MTLLVTISLAISTIAILISSYVWVIQRARLKYPPGPRAKPIVGNLYDIEPVRFRCFAEWARSYGPIISVWFGPSLNVVVSSAEGAREVLKENDQQLADRHRNRAAARFSRDGADLIWADYGTHYVKVRKLCTLELFTPKRLEAMRFIREEEVMAMVESLYKALSSSSSSSSTTEESGGGKEVAVREFIGAVAFNNITRLVFGKRFMDENGVMDNQGKEFKAIVTNGIKIGASLPIVENVPWLRFFYPLDEEAIAKHGARRDTLTKTIMDEHTRARQSDAPKDHFVDALLTLRDKYDLSDDTIIGLLWDMITAGMDTTAISVEWALAELIRNPIVQEKAQEELDRVIGKNRIMTEADISNLPYLQSVAKEALRLHPPTPLMLPHRANANVKLGGYDVPKGSIVHVNVWAIARDPEAWKDPEEFRPERFFEEDVDMKGHDYRLLPFGAGRRVCPGAQLGINLVTSQLGHLLHHFRWAPPTNTKDIDLTESPGMVTYMKTPLVAIPTPRLEPHLNMREAVYM